MESEIYIKFTTLSCEKSAFLCPSISVSFVNDSCEYSKQMYSALLNGKSHSGSYEWELTPN